MFFKTVTTADPTVALDAALTEWCAFRMGHGVGPVAAYHPEPVDQPLPDALATSPTAAAAVAFHDADRDAVEALTKAIVSKLLHEPSVRLKTGAGTPQGDRNAAAVRDLFDLG